MFAKNIFAGILFGAVVASASAMDDAIEVEFSNYKDALATIRVMDQAVLCAWGDAPYDISHRFNLALLEVNKTAKVGLSDLSISRREIKPQVYDTLMCAVLKKL